MNVTIDKALTAAVLAFLATLAGALLEGTLGLATIGVALGTGLAAGIATWRAPYFRERRSGRRRRRHRRHP